MMKLSKCAILATLVTIGAAESALASNDAARSEALFSGPGGGR
jgi:hypothetical protein